MESQVKMKKKLIITIALLTVLSTVSLTGCAGNEQEADERQIVEVQRGDLIVSITADGNLDMPRQVKLRFGTPGTVKGIFVDEGDKVKEGTLLAKLDDTAHKLAIASAQYDVELAMNELVEKIHPSIMGYPKFYPDTSALLSLEQAQKELEEAQELMDQSKYQEAMAKLRIVQHDLEASSSMLSLPVIAVFSQEYTELGEIVEKYPDIPKAIDLLEQDQERLAYIQVLVERGNYEAASAELDTAQHKLEETHRVVKGVCWRIRVSPLSYPDTSTSLDWLKQVEEELENIQKLIEQENYDEIELAETLRMAQHNLEMSHAMLEDNELIFRHGLNLKVLREYNLNLQVAESALQNAKEELMKTEILAPFDGTVVDVGVKENDQLSAYDYSSITAVHLVDTSTVEMDGVVDEIDIYKVKVGQEAIITLDALPDVELKGRVIFISPFGTEEAGVVDFPVTISLEPSEMELRGGLTATADLIVEKHEKVLLIPNGAIKGSPGDYWVEVVIDETTGETEKRQVVLGAQDAQFTEVISGLKEGDKVMVEAVRDTRGFF